MRKLLTATMVAAAAAVSMPTAGSADPYKWCAVYGGDAGGATNCGFTTIEQCRATVHGMGGFCEPNPNYTGPAEQPAKRARKDRNN
ncbi:MAG: DUF3551 domain-containing protein [Betaproteobacteria bacterium]|nr:DUF3551 domain-containing protein [Betaproteobacteria bacterium]